MKFLVALFLLLSLSNCQTQSSLIQKQADIKSCKSTQQHVVKAEKVILDYIPTYDLESWEFSVNAQSCSILWEMTIPRDNVKSARIRNREGPKLCTLPLVEKAKIYDSILCEITTQFPEITLTGFDAGALSYSLEFRKRMAVASVNDPLWKNFFKKKELFPNQVFVDVFNKHNLAGDLVSLFKKYSYDFTLSAVEKVATPRAYQLDYANEFPELKGVKQRVLEWAGVLFFKLKKTDNLKPAQ